jgi:hypothetical protein
MLSPDFVGHEYTEVWSLEDEGQTAEDAAEMFAQYYWSDGPAKITEWCGNLFRVEGKLSAYRIDYTHKTVEGWPIKLFKISRIHNTAELKVKHDN